MPGVSGQVHCEDDTMIKPKCRHRKPPRLPYQAGQADARRRMKRKESQRRCPVCGLWIWGEFWEEATVELKSYTFKAHIAGRVNARSDSDAVARICGLAGMYQDRGEWIEIEEIDIPEVVEDEQLKQE